MKKSKRKGVQKKKLIDTQCESNTNPYRAQFFRGSFLGREVSGKITSRLLTKAPLILLMSTFFDKNNIFTQSSSVKVVSEVLKFCFEFS